VEGKNQRGRNVVGGTQAPKEALGDHTLKRREKTGSRRRVKFNLGGRDSALLIQKKVNNEKRTSVHYV